MPELFQEMYCGPNVQNLVESRMFKTWSSPMIVRLCV